ncbi:MAG: ribosome recycling factor [Dehalococcoidia bacterium]|nr:ribosome recycling factor [Dehalococcoidia bacterium]
MPDDISSDDVLLDAEDRMEKAVVSFQHVLDTVRTGRASTSLVEHLHVPVYGQPMPLNQIATLQTPDASLITVQPWDKSNVNAIMKAIQASDIGINPSTDGAIIRLPVPPLTEARRKELVKQVNGRTEEARVAVRNVRRHAIDELRKLQKDGSLAEDDERRASEQVEKLSSTHIGKLEALARQKEHELLEV